MSKKTWIKIKRGIVVDPAHRENMGARIWLYLYMLDRANWEDGIIYEWRDKDEAADLNMAWRTLQDQRQQLEQAGYISCELKGNYQQITIRKWVNPREYSDREMNVEPQDNKKTVHPENGKGTGKGTTEGTTEGVTKFRTPTLYSHITYQLTKKEAQPLFEEIFTEASNIKPPDDWAIRTKRWRTPLWEMYKQTNYDAKATGDFIKEAVKNMRADNLTISAPQSIEKVFIDLYAKSHSTVERRMPNAADL